MHTSARGILSHPPPIITVLGKSFTTESQCQPKGIFRTQIGIVSNWGQPMSSGRGLTDTSVGRNVVHQDYKCTNSDESQRQMAVCVCVCVVAGGSQILRDYLEFTFVYLYERRERRERVLCCQCLCLEGGCDRSAVREQLGW